MESNLNKEQEAVLNILKTLIPLIEGRGLKYSMLGGTLLGAVRHKGFIPWDDDIDIGLPREDYEKFIQIATKELSEPLEIQSILLGNGHYYYARIINSEVKLLRSAGVKESIIYAWVDIFPIDGVPNGGFKYIWKASATFASKLLVASDFSYLAARDDDGRKRGFLRRTIRKIFKEFHLERFINTKQCARFLNFILKSVDYDHSKRVCNFMGYWGEKKEEFPKEIYDNLKKYTFEDIELYGPKDYDFVLTQMYGDYMTLPPESERDHHKTSIINEVN